MPTTKGHPGDNRTLDQIREQYEIERELADRLRNSAKGERGALYPALYNELFRRVPLHPQLTRGEDPQEVAGILDHKMRHLARFLKKDGIFAELGAGDCRLTMEVAKHVKQVYAVDVSPEVNKNRRAPANFEFVLTNGTDVPLPPGSVTVAYSYQLMEHIHPEDAAEQLTSIYRCLAPGGVYVCITPNRLTGPHDVSRHFDPIATGFHIREYTLTEVGRMFKNVGFEKMTALVEVRKRLAEVPIGGVSVLEGILDSLPRGLSRAVAFAPVIHNILMATVIGRKPLAGNRREASPTR